MALHLAETAKQSVFLRIQVRANSQTKCLERGWKGRARLEEMLGIRACETPTQPIEKKTVCFTVHTWPRWGNSKMAYFGD